MFPSHRQPPSPNFSSWRWPSGAASPLWSSSSSSFCPAGGARRGRRWSWKGTRRLPAKREKTPPRGKTKTRTEGEEEGDRERNRRITHFLSRSPSVSGDRGSCGAFLPTGCFTSTFLFNHNLWIPNLDQLMGSYHQPHINWECLCVESCIYSTLVSAVSLLYHHVPFISGEKQQFYQFILPCSTEWACKHISCLELLFWWCRGRTMVYSCCWLPH